MLSLLPKRVDAIMLVWNETANIAVYHPVYTRTFSLPGLRSTAIFLSPEPYNYTLPLYPAMPLPLP